MKFISYEEAKHRLKESFKKTLLIQKVFLDDAVGRVLATDIRADENSPKFATSAMDGYAIMYKDQKLKELRIVEKIPAGNFKNISICGGECVKTFTGSLMCSGSDTLIPIENVKVKDNQITIIKPVPKGFAIRKIGENYKQNELLIKKGTKIGFAEIAVMASLNISQVDVYAKPNVAIISTGSEILDVGETQTNPSQIRSSNHITLEILAKSAGANVLRAPLVKDDKQIIKKTILDCLDSSDIVVTTGGVSVGDYDFIRDILKELNGNYIIDGVYIKPGQHIKIVKIDQKYICALPGFAYSSTVTFILFVCSLIKKMQGLDDNIDLFKAILEDDFYKKTDKTEFTAVNVKYKNGKYHVNLQNKKIGSSAILTNILGDSALMVTDKKSRKIPKGEEVDIIFMRDFK